MDVGCAYLNARRVGLPPIFMPLSKELATELVEMEPSFADAVREDGSMMVELIGGLYGLIESGWLWYHNIADFLISLGFIVCDSDNCLFLKEEIKIALYVDDLFVVAKDFRHIEELHILLLKKYGEVKLNEGPIHTFLGMELDLTERGRPRVSINLSDLLSEVKGRTETPAGMNLFAIDDSPPLDYDSAARFHSIVAKLLWIAKRSRPDILLPVNFLCTRVRAPTETDLNKLNRILKYLNGTKDYQMELGMIVNDDGTLNLDVYIDASYAVHEDSKSHTGVLATIGKGCIYAVSSKQACVSKSSTEAELIAYTDYIGEAMELKNIVQDVTQRETKLIIHQDNQSTMSIVENGKVSGKSKHTSKHVKVRVAWLKERSDLGDFSTKYCPSEKMKSDGMTKPKGWDSFETFRSFTGVRDHHITKERAEISGYRGDEWVEGNLKGDAAESEDSD